MFASKLFKLNYSNCRLILYIVLPYNHTTRWVSHNGLTERALSICVIIQQFSTEEEHIECLITSWN
jgi:hypothetical protein